MLDAQPQLLLCRASRKFCFLDWRSGENFNGRNVHIEVLCPACLRIRTAPWCSQEARIAVCAGFQLRFVVHMAPLPSLSARCCRVLHPPLSHTQCWLAG